MSVQTTIFNRMTHQNEDSTSELLVNMMQQRFFRDICLRWLLSDIPYAHIDNIINGVHKDNIVTQCGYTGYGRPDIKIETQEGFFLIENKIHKDTDLQENQISNYIKIIEEHSSLKKITGLIFLIPRGYVHENYLIELKQNSTNSSQSHCAGINVSIKYWDDFIEYLYSQQINKISSLYEDSLDYLKSTIDSLVVEDTTLNSMETAMLFSSNQISAVYSLADKVTKLCKNFVDNQDQTKYNFDSFMNNIYGIGVNFNRADSDNRNSYFIGLSPSLCLDDKKVPEKFSFSMCFWSYNNIENSEDVYCSMDTSDRKPYYWIYMPLDKMILAETDPDKQQEMFNENAKNVLEKLANLEDKLNM